MVKSSGTCEKGLRFKCIPIWWKVVGHAKIGPWESCIPLVSNIANKNQKHK